MAGRFIVYVGELIWPFTVQQVPNIYVNYLSFISSRISCLVALRIYDSMTMPGKIIRCPYIDEDTIREFFDNEFSEHVDKRLHVIINEAVSSILEVVNRGLQELLKNTKLNIYFDTQSFCFKSGNGRFLIVVNYEDETPVTEFIGFPAMF